MTNPKPWQYESSWERKDRELAEFDALASNALRSVTEDPMAMQRARQSFDTWKGREKRKDDEYDFRQRISERVRTRREQQERARGVLGNIGAAVKSVGGAALEAIDRPRQAALGALTADNPVESVTQAWEGLTGEEEFSGEDLGFVRHLDEDSRARNVAGRIGEEVVDPLNLLIALKGPVLATRITASNVAAKAARMMLEPIATGGRVQRIAAEAGTAAVARYGGEKALEAVPEDAPDALKVGAALAGGLVTGAGAATAIGAGQRGVRAGVRAADEAALRSELRRPEGEPTNVLERARLRMATRAAERRPRIAGGAEEPVQGGLEGISPDQPTLRPENTPLETQAGLGIGSGERPIDDLPMFRDQPVTDTGVSAPRDVLVGPRFSTDDLPEIERIDRRIEELQNTIQRDDAGQLRRNKANTETIRQLGELQAARDIREALDRANGDVMDAMLGIEDRLKDLGEGLEARENRQSVMRRGRKQQQLGKGLELGDISGDLPVMRIREEVLGEFLENSGVERRLDPADRRAFAERYGIDIESRIETPEERALRETTARVMSMAESAGVKVSDDLAAKVASGDRIAMRSLQQQIDRTNARNRRNEGRIRLKATVEETRQRGVVLRRNAEDDLASVDLRDSQRASDLATSLGITDFTKAMEARIADGRPLTPPQVKRLRQQILNRMERMEPGDRERAIRDAGYEMPAETSRMDSPEVEEVLEKAGYVQQDGLMLAGRSGDPVDQAKALLPEDSPQWRFASGEDAPSGSQRETRIGQQLPPPPKPPRPPRGSSGFDPRDPAYQMPERGVAGIDDALLKTDAELQRAGGISRAVDAVAGKVPLGTGIVRGVRSVLNPAANHVRRIMVAYNAEGNTYAQLATQFKAVKLGITRQMEAAWDEEPPRYHGPDDNPFRGSVPDYLENPQWYDASTNVAAAARAWRDADLDMLRTVRGHYHVDILPFEPHSPDAVYIPHLAKQADFEEAFTQTTQRLAASGRRKHRQHETLYERWKATEDRNRRNAAKQPKQLEGPAKSPPIASERFDPELDLDVLQMHHAEALARMASQEVFIRGAGGKTRVELMDERRPGLRQAKEDMRRTIDNIENRLRTAMTQGRIEAKRTKDIAGKMTKQERRARPIIERMEDLGYEGGVARLGEWGSELSHEAGRLREIGLQWRHLRDELMRRGEGLEAIEARHRDLLQQYEASVKLLDRMKKAYETPLTGVDIGGVRYAQSNRTLRFHPEAEVAAIDALYRTTKDIPGLGRLQTAMEHWRGTVVTLDMTFLTIHGAFAALMNGPFALAPAMRTFRQAWDDPDFLFKIAQDEPEMVAEFARSSGFEWPVRGRERTGDELARNRGLEAIRYKGVGDRIQAFNDRQWRMVTAVIYNGWKKDRDALIEYGVPPHLASAEASHVVWSAVPRMNPRRTGRSQAHAEFERMLMISPSFLFQPATMLKDATSGLAKMAALKAGAHSEGWAQLLPRERLAVKRYGTLAGTIMAMSVGSAMLSAPFNNQNPIEAATEVMNPVSGKFASLVIANQGTISLGGAHRSMIRALFPRVNADGELEPLAGLRMMLKGKQHPALRSVLDQYTGRDFFGNDIEEGRAPLGFANRLWYAAEQGMPIWTQPMSAAARGSDLAPDSITEGMVQMAFGTLGYSFYERSAFEQFDRLARGRYGASFHDLAPLQQAELREEHPDLWAASIRRGREQRQQYQAHLELVRAEQMESDRRMLTGEITREAWLNNFRQRQQQLAGYREAIFADSPTSDRNTPLDRYFEQIDLAKGEDGIVDWNMVDEFKATLTPEEQDYIDANTGITRTVLGRVYRNVSKTYAEYLSKPKYAGYDADQAREIDQTWQQVRNVAAELAAGRDIETRHMLIAYQQLEPRLDVDDDILRGVQFRVLGRLRQTQDRPTFRAANPDIELFYGRGPLTDAQIARVVELGEGEMRRHEDDVMRDLAPLMSPTMPALAARRQESPVLARARALAAQRRAS